MINTGIIGATENRQIHTSSGSQRPMTTVS